MSFLSGGSAMIKKQIGKIFIYLFFLFVFTKPVLPAELPPMDLANGVSQFSSTDFEGFAKRKLQSLLSKGKISDEDFQIFQTSLNSSDANLQAFGLFGCYWTNLLSPKKETKLNAQKSILTFADSNNMDLRVLAYNLMLNMKFSLESLSQLSTESGKFAERYIKTFVKESGGNSGATSTIDLLFELEKPPLRRIGKYEAYGRWNSMTIDAIDLRGLGIMLFRFRFFSLAHEIFLLISQNSKFLDSHSVGEAREYLKYYKADPNEKEKEPFDEDF